MPLCLQSKEKPSCDSLMGSPCSADRTAGESSIQPPSKFTWNDCRNRDVEPANSTWEDLPTCDEFAPQLLPSSEDDRKDFSVFSECSPLQTRLVSPPHSLIVQFSQKPAHSGLDLPVHNNISGSGNGGNVCDGEPVELFLSGFGGSSLIFESMEMWHRQSHHAVMFPRGRKTLMVHFSRDNGILLKDLSTGDDHKSGLQKQGWKFVEAKSMMRQVPQKVVRSALIALKDGFDQKKLSSAADRGAHNFDEDFSSEMFAGDLLHEVIQQMGQTTEESGSSGARPPPRKVGMPSRRQKVSDNNGKWANKTGRVAKSPIDASAENLEHVAPNNMPKQSVRVWREDFNRSLRMAAEHE